MARRGSPYYRIPQLVRKQQLKSIFGQLKTVASETKAKTIRKKDAQTMLYTNMDYHQLRLRITKIQRAPATTREELTSLVEPDYLRFDSNKRCIFVPRQEGSAIERQGIFLTVKPKSSLKAAAEAGTCRIMSSSFPFSTANAVKSLFAQCPRRLHARL